MTQTENSEHESYVVCDYHGCKERLATALGTALGTGLEQAGWSTCESLLVGRTLHFCPKHHSWSKDNFSHYETKPTAETSPWATAGDSVNRPKHYNAGKFEVIDVIDDWKLGFALGNAVKYIARAAHKGRELEDLRKAAWYLKHRIEELEKKLKPAVRTCEHGTLGCRIVHNGVPKSESMGCEVGDGT